MSGEKTEALRGEMLATQQALHNLYCQVSEMRKRADALGQTCVAAALADVAEHLFRALTGPTNPDSGVPEPRLGIGLALVYMPPPKLERAGAPA